MIIYKVINVQNGKIYVGQTIRDLKTRKSEHLRAASNLKWFTHPSAFHVAISEHGSGSFEWEVLEVCSSVTHLNEREKFYIKLLASQVKGYNQTTGGAMDETMSEEIRHRIAESMHKVHQDPAYRAKVYPKLKGLTPPNKGVPMTAEQRAKVSAAKLAVYRDPTYVNPNKGQVRTEEQKANIRKGQEGNMAKGEEWQQAHKDQYTAEVRAKMRAAKLGKKPANTKRVMCVETGQIFNGLMEASKALSIQKQSIWLQIKGKLNRAGGKTFKYVD